MEDVVVDRIAGPQHAIGEHVRVRAAALAGDRVDAFDVLRPEIVEHLGDQPDGLVLAHAGLHRLVQIVVRRIDHRRGMRQQRDLVLRLDLARVRHQLLAVDDGQPFLLQREQDRRLDHVDADRLLVQAAHLELDAGSSCATSSARPISGDIAPRISGMPARDRSPSQSQLSWWCLAADPKSHRIGSSFCASSVKRLILSCAQVPMCVAVM